MRKYSLYCFRSSLSVVTLIETSLLIEGMRICKTQEDLMAPVRITGQTYTTSPTGVS